jgi:transcriptional regulator with XRE-family HTH domain
MIPITLQESFGQEADLSKKQIFVDERAEPKRIRDVDASRAKSLAKALKTARGTRSQEIVARMMGKTQSWIAKIETTGRVTFVHLERLAIIYGKPLSDFSKLKRADVIDEHGDYLGKSEGRWRFAARRDTAKRIEENNPSFKASNPSYFDKPDKEE